MDTVARSSAHTVLACLNYMKSLDNLVIRHYCLLVNVGSHIGQYRILRKIGVGGMGTVYLGEHILLGRRAAIKTLLPALSMQSEIVERFFTEARATSAITDHGVVQIFDFGYHVDGTAYIVMELLEGESLQTRIDRLGQIAPSVALRIARQVSGSLAAAHDKDIVHRDLKPENIYLIADPEAASGERTKILDFGICKLGVSGAEPALTQSGTTMGTPVYMSPEQCRGAGKVDHRSDIYALGCVLFHMVAGRPPFECEGAGEFIVAHLQEDPPTPSSFIPELPELVDGLILRCLEKSADDRFQSMTELQHALEYVIARISSTDIAVPSPLPPAMPMAAGYRSSYDLNIGTPIPTQSLKAPTPGSAKPATARRRKSNSSKSQPRARSGSQPAPISTGAGTPSSIKAAEDRVVKSGGEWFVSPDDAVVDDPRITSIRPRSRAAIAVVLFGIAAAIAATLFMTRDENAVAASTPLPENVAAASITEPAPFAEPAPVPVPAAAVAVDAQREATTIKGGPISAPVEKTQAATTAAATKAVDRGALATANRQAVNKSAKARPKAQPQRRPAARLSTTTPSSTPKSYSAPAEDLYDTR